MAGIGRFLNLIETEPKSSGGEFQSWPRQQRGTIINRVRAGLGGVGGIEQRLKSPSARPPYGWSSPSPIAGHSDANEPLFTPSMTPEARSYGIYAYGTTLLESGHIAKALGCYNRALVLQRESLGANHEVTGRTLRSIGMCLMKMGGEPSFVALTALEEALFIRQLNHGEDDEEARLITEDIWSLLHKNRSEKRDENATKDRNGMIRSMRKQASKKELQKFVFRSVSKRGATLFSSESVRNLQLNGPREDHDDGGMSSSLTTDVSEKSSFDIKAAATSGSSECRNNRQVSGEEIELDLSDIVHPTRANSAHRQHRKSLIGKPPSMKRIGEDSFEMSMHSCQDSIYLDEAMSCSSGNNTEQDMIAHQQQASQQDTNKAGATRKQSKQDTEARFWMSSSNAFHYSGTSFRNDMFGDLGDRWSKEADESYDSLKEYGSLRREAIEAARIKEMAGRAA